jgi:hypothetical protein
MPIPFRKLQRNRFFAAYEFWPYSLGSDGQIFPVFIDREVDNPPLTWEGLHKSPPGEVMEFLTAKTWNVQASFVEPGGVASAQSIDLTLTSGTVSQFDTFLINPEETLFSPGYETQFQLFESYLDPAQSDFYASLANSMTIAADHLFIEETETPGEFLRVRFNIFIPRPIPAWDLNEPEIELWYLPLSTLCTYSLQRPEDTGLFLLASNDGIEINGETHKQINTEYFPTCSVSIVDRY